MRLLPVSILLCLSACSGANSDRVPLLEGLGVHHFDISTESPEAQSYFDQGLRLTYGFNHAEAIRSFQEAIALDPTCAMCWWGVSLAAGPNINAAMDSAGGSLAWSAINNALDLANGAPEMERGFIAALRDRYGPDPLSSRSELNTAYASAMGRLAAQYPDHDDAQVLFADALMNLSPWDYWFEDGTPKERTEEILTALETVLTRSPDHAGGCHFYIHAVEKEHPEKAVPCADRLAELMPGAGHIVHMPAHIYIRVGRYVDAIHSNHAATHADEQYIEGERPQGLYPMAYYPHNYDFLAFAAAMAGHQTEALEAAEKGKLAVDPTLMGIPELGGLQNYALLPLRIMVRFGRWDAILNYPESKSTLVFTQGFQHYARGMAYARTNRVEEATQELSALKNSFQSSDLPNYYIWWNPANKILGLGVHALEAEISFASGDVQHAIELLEEAVDLESQLIYDEPPPWSVPSRQLLGRMLFDSQNYTAAREIFLADLQQYPENGWSLFGLYESLVSLNQTDQANEAKSRFELAWKTADAKPVVGSY